MRVRASAPGTYNGIDYIPTDVFEIKESAFDPMWMERIADTVTDPYLRPVPGVQRLEASHDTH